MQRREIRKHLLSVLDQNISNMAVCCSKNNTKELKDNSTRVAL